MKRKRDLKKEVIMFHVYVRYKLRYAETKHITLINALHNTLANNPLPL